MNGSNSPDDSAVASKDPRLRLPETCEPPGEGNPHKPAVWMIFGATGHMGRAVFRTVLSHGDRVTAVGWKDEHTIEQMQSWQEPPNSIGALCDIRIRGTVDSVIQKSIEHWGHIDVIAICTGNGVIGACEDQDDHDLRNQFETNFWGTLHIIQSSLPYFRNRTPEPGGRYLIFSSTSGALGVPGLGPYCATKYAVEGLIESMLYEVDTFNIKATLVEPGHVRLDEEDRKDLEKGGLKVYSLFRIKAASEPYSGPTAPASHAKRMVQWMNDRQPTSAARSAELVWQLAHCSYPPLRLILGTYAVESIRDRLRSIIEEIEDWKHLSFPQTEEEARAQEELEKKERERVEEAEREQEEEDRLMDGVAE
ncbi:hypothetical protein LTS18_008581 [Coniosporium uncinatum]|uniref:Uncharacterized protein n=1 Tax=Coniosporium uncinatum TaxID=93489 RepID=A0ACC3D1W0_9PEZI|nr:hypothetical protein LTS18_008581 [Coniosporium uncinatum]